MEKDKMLIQVLNFVLSRRSLANNSTNLMRFCIEITRVQVYCRYDNEYGLPASSHPTEK